MEIPGNMQRERKKNLNTSCPNEPTKEIAQNAKARTRAKEGRTQKCKMAIVEESWMDVLRYVH
jgi:hypothetical protein